MIICLISIFNDAVLSASVVGIGIGYEWRVAKNLPAVGVSDLNCGKPRNISFSVTGDSAEHVTGSSGRVASAMLETQRSDY